MKETAAQRIVREMSERWSSYYHGDYELRLHGDDWRDFWRDLEARIRQGHAEELMAKIRTPGPTYSFPEGRIHESDEGQIAIAIGVSRRTIIVEFGTSTKWIGFNPADARALAKALLEKADLAERQADA